MSVSIKTKKILWGQFFEVLFSAKLLGLSTLVVNLSHLFDTSLQLMYTRWPVFLCLPHLLLPNRKWSHQTPSSHPLPPLSLCLLMVTVCISKPRICVRVSADFHHVWAPSAHLNAAFPLIYWSGSVDWDLHRSCARPNVVVYNDLEIFGGGGGLLLFFPNSQREPFLLHCAVEVVIVNIVIEWTGFTCGVLKHFICEKLNSDYIDEEISTTHARS